MKNYLKWKYTRWDYQDINCRKTSIFEDNIEKSWTHRGKKKLQKMSTVSDLWDDVKWSNIYVTGVIG